MNGGHLSEDYKGTVFPSQLARELGWSVSKIQKLAREGKIPFTETPWGKHRRYVVSEVRAALRSQGLL